MKTLLHLSTICTCIIIFAACQKEVSYENFTGGNPTNNGGGGTTSSGDCKECAYFPLCEGSYYTYSDTTMGVVSTTTDTTHYIKDSTIDGIKFKKIFFPVVQQYDFINCTDGATRIITYNPNSLGGSTLAKLDVTILKANLAVGGTWQDQLVNAAGQTVIYKYKIAGKGETRVVNGRSYTDVIHVAIENGVMVPSVGYVAAGSQDIYFAKGIGQIEVISQAQGMGVYQHNVLTAYYIP